MSLDDARNFVVKLRENHEFRKNALQTKDLEDLALFLRGEGLLFDQRELIGAMAECMAQLEQQMGS
ncbi:MAG: Nif11-like leader peptide family natural product precursor [Deltaproteobacteria bacterium]|nr:Nif11-like leader peptide family natural product precursor [Deltaproteobacteria bacterium]